MQIDATTAALIASAIGALSSGGTAVAVLLITKRSEERRHLRELAMKAAVDNWLQFAEVTKQRGGNLLPLDVFVIHMLKLCEVISAGDLSAANLPGKLREVQNLVKIATAEAERFSVETSAN